VRIPVTGSLPTGAWGVAHPPSPRPPATRCSHALPEQPVWRRGGFAAGQAAWLGPARRAAARDAVRRRPVRPGLGRAPVIERAPRAWRRRARVRSHPIPGGRAPSRSIGSSPSGRRSRAPDPGAEPPRPLHLPRCASGIAPRQPKAASRRSGEGRPRCSTGPGTRPGEDRWEGTSVTAWMSVPPRRGTRSGCTRRGRSRPRGRRRRTTHGAHDHYASGIGAGEACSHLLKQQHVTQPPSEHHPARVFPFGNSRSRSGTRSGVAGKDRGSTRLPRGVRRGGAMYAELGDRCRVEREFLTGERRGRRSRSGADPLR
jgi:hypothetical protein